MASVICGILVKISLKIQLQLIIQGSHGIEKPRKSLEFVLVFFPGLEIGNSLENREISCKVGKCVALAPPKVM